MSGFSGLDLAAFAEATVAQRAEIAAEIAAVVEAHYPNVTVEVDGAQVTVAAKGPFYHFKEWGSPTSPPKGYMRSAAAAQGNFRPEGK